MKKLILASALSISLCSVAAFADTMNGYISDEHCGAAHSTVSEANTKCIEACIKKHDAVLVSDGKVYKIDAASQAKAKELAGKDVTVEGTLSGDTLTATSITAK